MIVLILTDFWKCKIIVHLYVMSLLLFFMYILLLLMLSHNIFISQSSVANYTLRKTKLYGIKQVLSQELLAGNVISYM